MKLILFLGYQMAMLAMEDTSEQTRRTQPRIRRGHSEVKQLLKLRRKRRRRCLAILDQLPLKSGRTVWKFDRPQGPEFWSNALKHFDDVEWLKRFRMSRRTFEYLLGLVEQHLRRKTTNWRQPLEPRVRLAIALWWYATPSEYRSISCIFGVGITTVCMTVREVGAVLKTLLHRFVSMPSGTRLQETVDGFAARGYPMCAGAIDGTHIPILTPRHDPASYYNRKGWHSVVLQAVVDHNLCFTDLFVGRPGRMHDAHIFANSHLFKKVEDEQGGYLFPREVSRTVNGVEIPVHIIGDPAYPLRKWLMKGFTNQQALTKQEQNYNGHLNSARMVAEKSFGRLKGRWRCLAKRLDIATASVSDVVLACCVLHNICEIHKEDFLPEWNIAGDQRCQVPSQVAHQDPQAHTGYQAIREAVMSIL
ncbi:putative nuclease HARBI1 [Sardina pilchardus]|uniref:putative nuclease HARBI1 n=1 Tax=Sardina pilchardus TaxID=27697 RepID=UPI002E0D93B4